MRPEQAAAQAVAAPTIVLRPPTSGKLDFPRAVEIYGDAGVGKSTLAAHAPDATIIDTDNETQHLDVKDRRVARTWEELRALVQGDIPGRTLVIDNISRAQLMAEDYTLRTVLDNQGRKLPNIEAYGYGKGYRHVYDTWLTLLGDLDRVRERGKNIILVAHASVDSMPNPMGEDFIRYEPRLQKQKGGPIQSRTNEWCSDIIFIAYDVASADGIGKGSGTRTIYSKQRPAWIAKSRPARDDFPWNDPKNADYWKGILK